MEFKGTKGEWSTAHLAVEDTTCNCGFVLSEGYCGSIATIQYSEEGADWREGDNPPLEEAKANARLIACAPEMFEMMKSFIEDFDKGLIEDFQIPRDRFEQTLTKATKI